MSSEMCKFYVEDAEAKAYIENYEKYLEESRQKMSDEEMKLYEEYLKAQGIEENEPPFECCSTCIYYQNGDGFPGETVVYCANEKTEVGIIDVSFDLSAVI